MKELTASRNKFRWFLVRKRKWVLVLFLLVSATMGYGVLKIKSEVILGDLFPYNHPFVKLNKRFAPVFGGGGSFVIIAVKARQGDIFNHEILSKITKITEEVELWDGIYRLQTTSISHGATQIAIPGAKGAIEFKPLMFPEPPTTEKGIAELKKNIFTTPYIRGTLVSLDGTAATIATVFKEDVSYVEAFKKLKSLKDRFTDDSTSIHISGFPMQMGYIINLKSQIFLVFVVSILLMIIIIVAVLQSFAGVLPPLILGVLTTFIGLGFIGWAGVNFSPLTFVLAFLVGARKLSHAFQITHRYLEELQLHQYNKEIACYETIDTMSKPNIVGVLTDGAGFAILFFAGIALMQQIAIIMAFWMVTIAAASLTPIICTFIPLNRASDIVGKTKHRKSLLDIVNTALSRFAIHKWGRWVVICSVACILAFSSFYADNMKVGDPSPGSSLLWPDHPYNRDTALINNTFNASNETFCLYFDGEKEAVYDPAVLTTFELFDRYMSQTLPDIYKSSASIANNIKQTLVMNRDGDVLWNQVPRDDGLLLGMLGELRRTTNPRSLMRFVDQDRERAQLILYFSDHTSDNIARIKKAADDFFTKNPIKLKNGEFKMAGGSIGLELALNQHMKETHASIDLMVLFIIFIMCSFFFRSFVAGLMLTCPLVIANLVAFCYMAINNIGLSVNTLPVAAVGVGVGVDFAIYLYSRCMEEFSQQKDWVKAVLISVSTCGKAIVYTGVTMILSVVPWYFLSELKFQAQMGFFLALLLLINVILSLTLHPLLILLIKPRFISTFTKNGALKSENKRYSVELQLNKEKARYKGEILT